jgi:amino acid transporter
MAAVSARPRGALARSIGFVPILFQAVTDTGPGYSVLFAIPAGAAFAAGSLPLAVLLAAVAMMLMAVVVGQLGRKYPSAGGFYTYNTRAFGARWGFLTGWGIVFENMLVTALGPLASAFAVVALLQLANITTPWGLWFFVFLILGAFLHYRGVTISLRAGVILGGLEMGIFAVLALIFIIRAGSANTLSVFTTEHTVNTGGLLGSGLFLGMIWAIYAFIGFENALPMAEEALEPKRAPQIAVFTATVVIGVFYLLTTYAGAVGFGVKAMATYSATSWLSLANNLAPVAQVLVLLAVLNSSIAIYNAAGNASSRMLYAMGRSGVLPRRLGTVSEREKTPVVAVLTIAVTVCVVDGIVGIWQGGPINALGWLGVPIVLITLVLTYMTSCVAVIFIYSRQFRAELNIWLHVVIPVLAFLAMLGPIYIAATSFNLYPFNIAVWLSVAWIVIGAVIALVGSGRLFTAEGLASLVPTGMDDAPTDSSAVLASTPANRAE